MVCDQEFLSEMWDRRAQDITQQPVPEDLRKKVKIICNDCQTNSTNQEWHFLDCRCPECDSFNTTIINP